jgi:lipid-A-disaccharide synthase
MQLAGMPLAMVAGEASGDLLAGLLLQGLRERWPALPTVGIGGPQMAQQGFQAWWPHHKLAVHGYVDALRHLREIYGIRNALAERLLQQRPIGFVGVDAPDFNLGLELRLRRAGIRTIHFVCPSIWAWRGGRVKRIARSCDHVLCLFPFEPDLLARAGVAATFVGHPLADALPLASDTAAARAALGLEPGGEYVALLPGSRGGEVQRIGPGLFAAARLIREQRPQARFLIPAINAARRADIEHLLAGAGLDAQVFDPSLGPGVGRMVMAAADVVVLASGTATLEAMLLKKPMVVAYRLHWLTFLIARLMVKSRFVSLPNLLAGERLVPELLQEAATAEALAREMLALLADPAQCAALRTRFAAQRCSLRAGGAAAAADAVLRVARGAGPE